MSPHSPLCLLLCYASPSFLHMIFWIFFTVLMFSAVQSRFRKLHQHNMTYQRGGGMCAL